MEHLDEHDLGLAHDLAPATPTPCPPRRAALADRRRRAGPDRLRRGVRGDVRSNIFGATGVASGVPLTVVIELVNTSASVTNLSRITFATDNVFSDGVTTQLAAVTGNLTDGYVARLQVGIAV